MKINIRSRKRTTIALAVAGALVALPALAAVSNSGDLNGQSQVLLGGGSDTTYVMHNAIDRIYNEAPGCYQTVTSTSVGNFGKCLSVGGSQTPVAPQALSDSNINVQHDTIAQLYPVGSGNGIKQLLDGGLSDGVPVLSFARSSRALAAGNETKYLNSSAFAGDAISWHHFTKIDNKATAHAALKNLTLAQLAGIYRGTITTWNELMPTDKALGLLNAYVKVVNGRNVTVAKGLNNGNPETDKSKLYVYYRPIKVYFGQDGSGTAGTWHAALKAGDSSYSGNGAPAQYADDLTTCVNFCRVFENDASYIPIADAPLSIYFYSYGRYTNNNISQSPAIKGYTYGAMAGNSTGRKNWTDALGQIGGVDVTATTILSKTFPVNRFVYVITKQNPVATVKNYVNFLCSASMDTAKDHYGKTIRPQIEAAIKAEGFVPLTKALDGGLDNVPAMSYCRTTVATG